MKRILIIFLALVLVACGSPAPAPTAEQPTSAPPQPTQTAAILLQTVVVTVIPTQAPTDVPPPTSTPLPPPTEVQATQPPPPTEAVAAPTEAGGGLITLEDALGAGWFVNLTRSRNDFSLRCKLNQEIAFSVKPTDANITQVDFFYRMEDRATGAVFDWQNAGRMIRNADGSFSLVFSGDDVNANFRKPNAWFDYQYIGGNGSGVVGRSEKIQQQVTYTFDCP
ncbi:MAG TPA: hypothetical protein VK206_19090 [Anaerolineales bacterium]|nr:hypothetical protein [Anaerolineales bacterium]